MLSIWSGASVCVWMKNVFEPDSANQMPSIIGKLDDQQQTDGLCSCDMFEKMLKLAQKPNHQMYI